ncbi:phospholipase D-like domain-containing protein [Photobacterium sp. DNB22_13_2]
MKVVRKAEKDWVNIINSANGNIDLYSPFLSDCRTLTALTKAAKRFKKEKKQTNSFSCKVYTFSDRHYHVSNWYQLDAMESLLEAGVEIYMVENLHLKALVVGQDLQAFGSQNTTAKGQKINRELGAIYTEVTSEDTQKYFNELGLEGGLNPIDIETILRWKKKHKVAKTIEEAREKALSDLMADEPPHQRPAKKRSQEQIGLPDRPRGTKASGSRQTDTAYDLIILTPSAGDYVIRPSNTAENLDKSFFEALDRTVEQSGKIKKGSIVPIFHPDAYWTFTRINKNSITKFTRKIQRKNISILNDEVKGIVTVDSFRRLPEDGATHCLTIKENVSEKWVKLRFSMTDKGVKTISRPEFLQETPILKKIAKKVKTVAGLTDILNKVLYAKTNEYNIGFENAEKVFQKRINHEERYFNMHYVNRFGIPYLEMEPA